MPPETTIHQVFAIDDEEFLDKLRDEDLAADDLESYANDQSPSCFSTSTGTDLDVHRLLAALGLRWSEDAEVEDLDGLVKLLDEDAAELALSKIEALVENPKAAARRIATILVEELAAKVDEAMIGRIAAALEEEDARAVPEEDTEADTAAQILVQHLHALRTAAEHGLWLATASYLE